MAIDHFTQKEFEEALPKHKDTKLPMCQCIGMEGGELTYFMPIDDFTGIIIRSSIDGSGHSADTGDDSIRAWLVDAKRNPLGSKVSKYTNRLPGWNKRLVEVLRTLWKWRKEAGNCPQCHNPMKIFKIKKAGPNKGKVFTKCDVCEQAHRPSGWRLLEN